jgi:hypothetical protein
MSVSIYDQSRSYINIFMYVLWYIYTYRDCLKNKNYKKKKLWKLQNKDWIVDKKKNTFTHISPIPTLLVHLRWKIKWAFLIARCPVSVLPSVCTLLNFWLLIQNHWTNFNHTWHKSSLGEGIQVCSNEGDSSSPRGDYIERVKIHWNSFKIFFSRTSRPNSIKLGTQIIFGWREFKFIQIKGKVLFKEEIMIKM